MNCQAAPLKLLQPYFFYNGLEQLSVYGTLKVHPPATNPVKVFDLLERKHVAHRNERRDAVRLCSSHN